MRLIKVDDKYIFEGGYQDRAIPKAARFRWNPNKRVWWTADAKLAARLVGAVDMAPDLQASLAKESGKLQASSAMSRSSDAEVNIPVPDGLDYYGFQKAGIAYALGRPNTLFGDEMGIGKTIQAIGVINATPEMSRVLVICPASLRLNWKKELERWLVRPLSIGVAIGDNLPDADIVVINYDILGRHAEALTSHHWDIAIIDEAHYLKNSKTKRFKAVQAVVTDIPRMLALTGTPIPNRPVEGFPIFNLLAPEVFKKFTTYAFRYCNPYRGRFGWDFTGASNLGDLQATLRETIMVRRLKTDVLTELPPKVRQIITLPANGMASAVKAEAKTLAKWEDVLGLDQPKISFEEISQARHETAIAKAPYVADHVKEILAESAKVVVMAHHHDVIDALADALAEYNPVTLTGRDNITQRDAAVTTFQNDPDTRVFIGSIQAAGVGITLTSASTVVFAELDWVPGNVSQAEDRLHRIGQKDSVLVQHLVVDGTLDARMAGILISKQKILDQALDNPDAVMDEESIMDTVMGVKAQAKQAKAKAAMAAALTDAEVSNIHDILRHLAERCDGAQALDGAGFNGSDTDFGKALAHADTLTKPQALAGKRLAKKYHRQIPADLFTLVYGEAS